MELLITFIGIPVENQLTQKAFNRRSVILGILRDIVDNLVVYSIRQQKLL